MGSRVGRMFRNVNLENRVQREISKEKPRPAPRHAVTQPTEHDGNVGTVHQKNNDLLSNLKSVYVESINTQTVKTAKKKVVGGIDVLAADYSNTTRRTLRRIADALAGDLTLTSSVSGPPTASVIAGTQSIKKGVSVNDETKCRPTKFFLPGNSYGLANLTEIPRGKLTITEAIKAVGSHQNEPQTWTSQKIAKEYSLDLKETNSLLEFFIPFQVQILPPVNVKQLKVV
ncbi:NADH dehydrogenase [ubiquinone] 1 alpha subcomplex assembly factor 4 isoform X1 [Entelurus aequoreus]|uniref:NADH dehydrogenase [ubiquinone] 1 alpha subcomplex assembly factor 4 isoform X1 n=1 Tax=Entelurus aequoreus TaxID=161455 RepID=UPI002B1DD74A|nr:NADH dehydrogenase [ubiquinone] 1 alpha subcomplex assembly factor 4 isoform X1 [Entelurus aequoreus]